MTDKHTNEALVEQIKNLEETIEIYSTLLNNTQDLLYRTDLEGRITYVSPSVFRLSGYTVDEAIGMRMAEKVYLVPQERQDFLSTLKSAGRITNFEARLKRKDGSVWWASTNAHFYTDKEGNILGIEGITRDISELKEKENSLKAAEERFRLAFHTSPDSVVLNRVSDGMYVDINQGFTDITGYTREDVKGRTSYDINIWHDVRDRERLVEGLRKNGFYRNLEAKFVKKNGEIITGLMSARTLIIHNEMIFLGYKGHFGNKTGRKAEKGAGKTAHTLPGPGIHWAVGGWGGP